MNTASMKALYQNYNQAAVAQQMMTHTGAMTQQIAPPQPPQKRKVFAKLSNSERGFYANLFAQADKKGIGRIEGLEAVQFLKKSGLPKNILKDIWDLSAYSDPKFLNKDEFYVALKLIAYAQNNMDPTIDSVITNLPVALPSFKFSDQETQQTKAIQKPESTINVDQLPDLDQISPEMIRQAGPTSFVQKKAPQQSVSAAPAAMPQSPFMITQPELMKYNRIFQNFDQTKKGFLEQSQAKEVFQKTKLSVDILKQVWNMVDWMDRGILDKFSFIMALHLLHRCKTGVQLPPEIPPEMWASFGQTGLNFMAQVKKMKELKKSQQSPAASSLPAAQPQEQQQPPQADLLQEDSEPIKKEEFKEAEPQFMNLIEDAGFQIPKPAEQIKVESKPEEKPAPPKDLFFFGDDQPEQPPKTEPFSEQSEPAIEPLHSPVAPQIQKFEALPSQAPSLGPPEQTVTASSYSAAVPSHISTGVSSGHMKALQSQVDFLEQQASQNRQILEGMQQQSSRMEQRMFELERYLEQLRQTIKSQSEEMRKEKERLGLLSKEYDQKMKGYQDNLAQLQVINEQRRSIQEDMVKKEVGIAQANSNAQVAQSFQNYDRKMSIDSYKYNQGYYNQNQYQQHQRDPSWQKSPNEAYSNHQMEWDNYNKDWNAQTYNQPEQKEEQFDFQMHQREESPPSQKYEQPQEHPVEEVKQEPPQYQNEYYDQQQYGGHSQAANDQQGHEQAEPAVEQREEQGYNQNYYNQEVSTPQNNESKQPEEERASRRSTVSKSWRFQMINQMQADSIQNEPDFQNFNQQHEFEGWSQQQPQQSYEQKQEKQEDAGFDMKFEGNFQQEEGGSRAADPGGFNFEWEGGEDQKKEEKKEKKQEGGDDGWMDFQSNVPSGEGANNGFGEGAVSFDFS